MNSAVTKVILDNGLTVLLKEMHHAPVISFMIWYRVGSRNERPGITGISHWIEHMLFKGTSRFQNGDLDRLISRVGGFWNAFTWLDFTGYYETMPAEEISLALQLEADRMVNSQMDQQSVESERMVILSERGMYANDPQFLLTEALTNTAFREHPYRYEVIGEESDLVSMGREDLMRFYRQYYVPNNAVIVACGDFQTASFLQQITAEFGSIPSGPPQEQVQIQESPQQEERRIDISGPGDTEFLTIAYHTPAGDHEDYYALAVLNSALAGGGSLGSMSDGGTNRTSRLYKALVDTEIAVGVGGSFGPTIDPFLYTINVVVHPNSALEEAEKAVEAEIRRLKTQPIDRREFEKAIKRAKVQFVLAGESISGQANILGLAEVVTGDYRWYEQILDKLNAVTREDLLRVLDRYLIKNNRIVASYHPEGLHGA